MLLKCISFGNQAYEISRIYSCPRFLLVNAYQGLVYQQHYYYQDRKEHVTVAKDYYKDFHQICQLYGVAKVNLK